VGVGLHHLARDDSTKAKGDFDPCSALEHLTASISDAQYVGPLVLSVKRDFQ
jgi:hypothetical protein